MADSSSTLTTDTAKPVAVALPRVIAFEYRGLPEERAAATVALHCLLGVERCTQREDGCEVFSGSEDEAATVDRLLKGWRRYQTEAEKQDLVDVLSGAAVFAMVIGMSFLFLLFDFVDYLDHRHAMAGRPLPFGWAQCGWTLLGAVPLTMVLVTVAAPRRPNWRVALKVAVEPFGRPFRRRAV